MCPFAPLHEPNVSATSSSSVYRPLPGADSFRLLEILPGDGDVRCKLHVCSLKGNETAYEALSYTWSEPNSFSDRKIEVIANFSSHSMVVSGNLFIALRELRRSNTSRLIWADAICINQEDFKERGQQVSMMGEIFSGAWQVIIWLGEETDRCACGKTILKSSVLSSPSAVSKAFEGICLLVNDWLAQSNREDITATYSNITKDGQTNSHNVEIGDFGTYRYAVMQLFTRHWFSRMWVLQEVVLARHAIVQLGSYRISWEWIGLAAAIIVHKPELSSLDFAGETIPNGVMHAYLMYRLSSSQKCFRPLTFSFAQLLQVTRLFKSKDPKDKIYGLLGIPTTDSLAKRIVPDYREETDSEQVFEDIARLMSQSDSPLTFLSGAGTFGRFIPGGPSWVPSWHEPRPWTILPTKLHPGFQCASTVPVEIDHSSQAGELVIRGVIVDPISSWQEDRDPWEIFDQYDKSRENFMKQQRWSREDLNKCALTLSCGGDGRAYPVEDENTHLADMAALVLSGRSHWVTRDLVALRDFIKPERTEMTQSEYLEELAVDGNPRRYINAVEPLRYSYRLFFTKSGNFGVGPLNMRVGDILVVLFGAEVPFLVRPQRHGYSVVGECYVHNLMHGEILDKIASDPDGALKASWIKLV
ncbi:heterokaryon incompatibility (het-6OR allele) [Fusarium beomiforme]|uniref:Heterokaryon incompatibility (Het-6OR allele) n=1 Tax=Fusarium beomiforme TaxID=44412 RepID=A0A9P5DVV8_9HYPO|nr:heterokaryon incompatibility (het-6OR allele) [Fusarium beomiforme]